MAYAIGVAEPVSVLVETFGTGAVSDEALGAVDEVVLSALDGDLPLAGTLARAFTARGLLVEQQQMTPSPYIKLPATWDAYLAALSGSGRYLVNRSLRDYDKWAGADSRLVRVTNSPLGSARPRMPSSVRSKQPTSSVGP